MLIKKKSGAFEEFDLAKIKRSLLMAFAADGAAPDVSPLVHRISERLVPYAPDVTTDIVASACLSELMASGWSPAASRYLEKRSERWLDASKVSKILADYICISKYARAGERSWAESVSRVKRSMALRYPSLSEQIEEAYGFVERRHVLPSMRSMQFMPSPHDGKMYNCSFALCDKLSFFSKAFYLLLCGCGVGYSVQWEHILQLPSVATATNTVRHIRVEDTIEGWADGVEALIRLTWLGYWVELDYSPIRPEGAPLKTSGGKAPGHLGLRAAVEAIRGIIRSASGRKIRPIEAHKIMCHLARAVLSGGVRRSSLISLFSMSDSEMLYCKSSADMDPILHMANNSAVLMRNSSSLKADLDRIIEVAGYFGEPGFFFSNNVNYGTNPCGEIGLNPVLDQSPNFLESGFSFCNLTEVNCTMGYDLEAFGAAAFIGTLQAGFTNIFPGTVTPKIMARDALLGVSMTGIVDANAFEWPLGEAVSKVISVNKRTAKAIGINAAQRLTCVKPSGTGSLALGGVSSGIHSNPAERYIRRVTAKANEKVAKFFLRYNPHCVETKPDGDLCLLFPIQASYEALDAERQIRNVIDIYNRWVKPGSLSQDLTHNVSATITLDEGERVNELIYKERESLAALSFAPRELRYQYLPREAVTDAARWNFLVRNFVAPEWHLFENTDGALIESACESGHCVR